jgi:MYXO-CTERM domain-containing protein
MNAPAFSFSCRRWLAIAALALGTSAAHADVLYDPSTQTLPSQQDWVMVDFLGTAQVKDGLFNLSSAGSNSLKNGIARTDQTIDSDTGTTLNFSFQTLSESHANANRAGFSVILLDSEHRGIELGFWTNQIWAQSGADFLHAEGASFNTTVFSTYSLTLEDGFYSLSSGGTTLLTGAMRDYSSFGSVYTQTNLIYMGDDTSSAQGSVKIGAIGLTTGGGGTISSVPEPSTTALWLGALALLGAARRRRLN